VPSVDENVADVSCAARGVAVAFCYWNRRSNDVASLILSLEVVCESTAAVVKRLWSNVDDQDVRQVLFLDDTQNIGKHTRGETRILCPHSTPITCQIVRSEYIWPGENESIKVLKKNG